jgi:hypothetical protein
LSLTLRPSSDGTISETLYPRTSMRRHILSSRRGGRCVANATAVCPSRYASIRTLKELTLFGGSVHRMRSVLIRAKKALQSSDRSLLLKEDQVRIAQSPSLEIRSAMSGKKSRGASPHVRRFRAVAVPGSSPPFYPFAASFHCFSKPPGLQKSAGRCAVARRVVLRSPTDCAKAPRAFSLRPPPPVSWRSCLPEKLTFLHGV